MSLEQPDILIDPDLIPETILEEHRRENRTRALPDGLLSLILHGTRGHTFPIALENVGWRLMFENGLASALIDCVLDEHLCGFSRAELTSWPGDGEDAYLTDVLPYVNRLLRGIIVAAAFLRECQAHPRDGRPAETRVKADMHAIWCASHQVWRRLWDIRTPFLDAQPRGRAFTYGSPIQLQFHLHYFSAVLANYETVAHPSYPEPAPEVPNRRQHVMLALWMHAERRKDRTLALIEAKVAVAYEEIHFGDSTWSDLYEEAVAGRAQGRELLRRAMVRGFGAEENIAHTVHSLFSFVCAFWPPHELDEARRENLIPRDVLVASIAGWRTQICMSDARGVARDEGAIYRAMGWQLNYLVVSLNNERVELTERDVLGVVLLISRNMALAEDPVILPQICSVIAACRSRLQHCRSAPRANAELETLRWRMTVTWSSTMNTLERGTSSLRGRRPWMSLREPLEVAKYTNQVPERDGPPGPGMCAWDECECCYHRPIHPMRACTGCHMVTYCNAHCQEKHWAKGHGSLCRGRRRA